MPLTAGHVLIASPLEDPRQSRSPHVQAAQLLPGPAGRERPVAPSARALVPADTGFSREVMGYFSSGHGYSPDLIPYEHLTYLNWFGIDIDGAGNITSTNGWGGTTANGIVSTAHGYGVKVLVTLVEFDDTTICTLLNSSANRSRLLTVPEIRVYPVNSAGVQDYLSTAAAYREKIILGLQLYGYNWPSTGSSVPGDAIGTATSIKWKEAQDGAAAYGSHYDAGSDTPYYSYDSSGWHQVWLDNVANMENRFEYIDERPRPSFRPGVTVAHAMIHVFPSS